MQQKYKKMESTINSSALNAYNDYLCSVLGAAAFLPQKGLRKWRHPYKCYIKEDSTP